MKIIKRNGRIVNFNANKITKRIKQNSVGLKVDSDRVAIEVIGQMADNMTTIELDNLCCELASTKAIEHPDYKQLAANIWVTSMRKGTPDKFSEAVIKLEAQNNLLDTTYIKFVLENAEALDEMIVQDRDFGHDIFGLKTLERSYLLTADKDHGKVAIERPQYMWMRTAIQVSEKNLKSIKETYDDLSRRYYTHATPTLFNSGTKSSQLSSCFLLGMKEDSIAGIYDTLSDCAKISQWAGGIGLHIHNVRAAGSHIVGTNGTSNGIVPMLRVFNETARYVDQGGGKRKGSFAIYMEPWHADIYDLLELRKNTGAEERRARDLFSALWMNDEFMRRVISDSDWSLFCPDVLKKNNIILQEAYGEEFEKLYSEAEVKGLANKVVKARDLWEKILTAQTETGNPYIAYKDRVNKSSNQKNIGTIQSSNLCIEINEYSDGEEQAVCNLASIALSMFVKGNDYDFNHLGEVTRRAIRNLDNVIDVNFYPTTGTDLSNNRHRPIGLGVQGLADVFAKLRLPFSSDEAKALNKKIFEVIYYNALVASNELAKEKGVYSTFDGSPASKGILQFDMYDEGEWDFEGSEIGKAKWLDIKAEIVRTGLRNSLLLALMPTASTSQILGNNEAFEPFTSNLYTRRTLSGEFIMTNDHLVRELEELGIFDSKMRNDLKASFGSVLNIPRIPTEIKEVYQTAYELSMKHVIDMAADRQRFVCQAQSMNLFMSDINNSKLSSMHSYGWKKGLKTGIYYLRSKSAVNAIQFTVEKEEEKPLDPKDLAAMISAAKNGGEEDCEMCGA